MDNLGSPRSPSDENCLTIEMLNDAFKSLWESYDRAEEKRWKYYAALRPLLDQLKPDDLDGIYAVVVLTQSGFYEPIHPDQAKHCLEIVRSRGIKDFDR